MVFDAIYCILNERQIEKTEPTKVNPPYETIVPDGQLAKQNMLSTVNRVHLFKDNFEGSINYSLVITLRIWKKNKKTVEK